MNKTLSVQEARLKAKAERDADAPVARAEYEAERLAVLERTAKLRAERLKREAAEAAAEAAAPAGKKTPVKKSAVKAPPVRKAARRTG